MFIRNKDRAPVRHSDGLSCHLMLQEDDVRGDQIAVTWVDVEPQTRQQLHRHVPQQVYIITSGRGRMTVGQQVDDVGEGDVIYVPSNVLHGIENSSYDELLTYLTAATPAFDISSLIDVGEKTAVAEEFSEVWNKGS